MMRSSAWRPSLRLSDVVFTSSWHNSCSSKVQLMIPTKVKRKVVRFSSFPVFIDDHRIVRWSVSLCHLGSTASLQRLTTPL